MIFYLLIGRIGSQQEDLDYAKISDKALDSTNRVSYLYVHE